MYKTLLVARQEFLTNIRKRSFLVAAFGVPLLTIALMGVIIFVTASAEGNLDRFLSIGVVDNADVIVYADDDTEPEPAWLAALEEPFLRDPHIGVVGGEVLQARAQRGPIADFFRRYMGET